MNKLVIPEHFVTYIPGDKVKTLKEPSLIVSIKGRFDTRPEIHEKHTVFRLDFDVGDWAVEGGHNLQPEQIDELIKFLDENPKRDLYIHCTEGRCRSFTMASLLRRFERRYRIETLDITGPGGWMDRPTCNTFHRWMEAREEVERAQADEPSLDAPA